MFLQTTSYLPHGAAVDEAPSVEAIAVAAGVPKKALRLLKSRALMALDEPATSADRSLVRLLAKTLALGIPEEAAIRLLWGPRASARHRRR